MKVAQWVAEFLVERGCTHAFGLVGGANSVLFYAISERMKVVCVAHEQAAAMAATYYYRISGRIAPVLPTAGAGCVNTFTGVMAAHMDGIPLLVISGNEKSQFFNTPQLRGIGFQGFNPEKVVPAFVKQVVSVDNPLATKYALDNLYRRALEHRQGAVWLDIPQNIASEEVETA
jgi:acetolactate synthase-1/2/3 large subunit